MNLTKQILQIILSMRSKFAQQRSFIKFIGVIFAVLCTAGRHTITSYICFLKLEDKDWSPFYRFFAKVKWEPNDCLNEVLKLALKKALSRHKDEILISFDDFRVEKTGKNIPFTNYQLQTNSPPFRHNLMWGHRYIHASLTIARKKRGKWQAAKTIPVAIELAPHIKKPGKKATEEDWAAYEQEKIEQNLSQYALLLIKALRELCDQFGYSDKKIVIVADGSYCNKTIFRGLPDRVELITRCRKDAKLCGKSEEKRRFYDKKTFTPKEIYKDEKTPIQQGSFFYGRKTRGMKFKEKGEVYWKTGALRRPLKCVVVFGIRYRRKKSGYTNYREPMYLLTTDLKMNIKTLIQFYLYRWEIEVTHRELKNNLGISDAQVRNKSSVIRCPKTVVLANSIAHLAQLELEDNEDKNEYLQPPKWYKTKSRISLEDIRRRLRKEIVEDTQILDILGLKLTWKDIFERIAA
jgi:hypothetical protein